MNHLDRLSRNLSHAMERQGLSARGLADRLSVTCGSVRNYRTGSAFPKVEILRELEGALDLAPGALLDRNFAVPQDQWAVIYCEAGETVEPPGVDWRLVDADVDHERERAALVFEFEATGGEG